MSAPSTSVDTSAQSTASTSGTKAAAASGSNTAAVAEASDKDKAAAKHGSTGDQDKGGKDGDKTAASTKAPNPLDGLGQSDLRKKLDATKKELRATLDRKRKLDQELGSLEASIYAFEGSYLSDALLPSSSNSSSSAQFGNIIKGYDAYLKAPGTSGDRKRGRGNDEPRASDRVFSMSSATYQKAVESRGGIVVGGVMQDPGMDSASEEETSSSTGRRKRRH